MIKLDAHSNGPGAVGSDLRTSQENHFIAQNQHSMPRKHDDSDFCAKDDPVQRNARNVLKSKIITVRTSEETKRISNKPVKLPRCTLRQILIPISHIDVPQSRVPLLSGVRLTWPIRRGTAKGSGESEFAHTVLFTCLHRDLPLCGMGIVCEQHHLGMNSSGQSDNTAEIERFATRNFYAGRDHLTTSSYFAMGSLFYEDDQSKKDPSAICLQDVIPLNYVASVAYQPQTSKFVVTLDVPGPNYTIQIRIQNQQEWQCLTTWWQELLDRWRRESSTTTETRKESQDESSAPTRGSKTLCPRKKVVPSFSMFHFVRNRWCLVQLDLVCCPTQDTFNEICIYSTLQSNAAATLDISARELAHLTRDEIQAIEQFELPVRNGIRHPQTGTFHSGAIALKIHSLKFKTPLTFAAKTESELVHLLDLITRPVPEEKRSKFISDSVCENSAVTSIQLEDSSRNQCPNQLPVKDLSISDQSDHEDYLLVVEDIYQRCSNTLQDSSKDTSLVVPALSGDGRNLSEHQNMVISPQPHTVHDEPSFSGTGEAATVAVHSDSSNDGDLRSILDRACRERTALKSEVEHKRCDDTKRNYSSPTLRRPVTRNLPHTHIHDTNPYARRMTPSIVCTSDRKYLLNASRENLAKKKIPDRQSTAMNTKSISSRDKRNTLEVFERNREKMLERQAQKKEREEHFARQCVRENTQRMKEHSTRSVSNSRQVSPIHKSGEKINISNSAGVLSKHDGLSHSGFDRSLHELYFNSSRTSQVLRSPNRHQKSGSTFDLPLLDFSDVCRLIGAQHSTSPLKKSEVQEQACHSQRTPIYDGDSTPSGKRDMLDRDSYTERNVHLRSYYLKNYNTPQHAAVTPDTSVRFSTPLRRSRGMNSPRNARNNLSPSKENRVVCSARRSQKSFSVSPARKKNTRLHTHSPPPTLDRDLQTREDSAFCCWWWSWPEGVPLPPREMYALDASPTGQRDIARANARKHSQSPSRTVHKEQKNDRHWSRM